MHAKSPLIKKIKFDDKFQLNFSISRTSSPVNLIGKSQSRRGALNANPVDSEDCETIEHVNKLHGNQTRLGQWQRLELGRWKRRSQLIEFLRSNSDGDKQELQRAGHEMHHKYQQDLNSITCNIKSITARDLLQINAREK